MPSEKFANNFITHYKSAIYENSKNASINKIP